MKSKYSYFVSYFVLFITFVIGGCVSGPQYFPKQLENWPTNELAQLLIDGNVRGLQIDGQKTRITSTGYATVYLAPGDHVLNYLLWGETQKWRSMVSSLEKKGFVPTKDGREFVRFESRGGHHLSKEKASECEKARGTSSWYWTPSCLLYGHTKTARPIGVSRYGWNTISDEVSLKSGVAYRLSNLREGNTPLVVAGPNSEPSKMLLEAGDDINTVDNEGNTPLMVADPNSEPFEMLLEAGADVNAADREGRMPLHKAVAKKYNDKAVKMLLEAGADVNAADREERTPLHEAAKQYNDKAVKMLLEAGANVNVSDLKGRTPLHEAARNYKAFKMLFEAGADVNTVDKEGNTPLMVADPNSEPFKMLLEAGANVNVSDSKGRTPLHKAAAKKYNDKGVKMLLEAGADVNAADKEGRTPLHEAAAKKYNDKAVKMLLEAGADPNMVDSKGISPIDIAYQKGNGEIVKLLKKYSANG